MNERSHPNLATRPVVAAPGSDLRSEIATLAREISALRTEASAIQAANKAQFATLATKIELNTAFAALRSEIVESRSAIGKEIAEAKADILKWVIGLVLVQGGVVVTLVKLLPTALR